MKHAIKKTIIAAAFFGLMSSGHAEETKPVDHTAHHPEAPAAESKKEASEGMGMMGKMKMSDMQSMMDKCMKNNKDGKMCGEEMMQKCEKKMEKSECMKMMKEAKPEVKK